MTTIKTRGAPWPVTIRRANPADAVAMAEAHRDSIQRLGAAFYPVAAVAEWAAGVSPGLYVDAMHLGEVFFIATGSMDGEVAVLGFSSDYELRGTTHGTSVYVRSAAARQGVGSALLAAAEEFGRAGGATDVEIQASLAGVDFYRSHGYSEIGPSPVRLATGRFIDCVLMRKQLG